MSEIESRPELDGADEPVNYKSVEYSDLTMREPRPRMIHRHYFVVGLDGVERVRRQVVAPLMTEGERTVRDVGRFYVDIKTSRKRKESYEYLSGDGIRTFATA